MVLNLSKATDDQVGDGFKLSRFTIKGKDLAVDGHLVLDVPANIRITPASTLVPTVDVSGTIRIIPPMIDGPFQACLKPGKVEQVYVWHALCGNWGGLRPGAPGLPPAKVVPPKLSPGLQRTMENLAVSKIVNNGVGLVDPRRAHELYEGLHSNLQASGIDGVKVDVIHMFAADAPPASTSANDVAAEGNRTPRPAFAMRSGEFILDSGARCHATGDMDLLVDFTPAPQTGRSVCVANGSLLPILGHGCVRLQGSVTLPGVLYVPGLVKNIVSVSRLCELDYSVTFSQTRCFIREACDGTVVGEGRRVNGLFPLDYLRVPLGRARCAACLRLGSG